ncbi:M56 family metallopeptidase [Streptomyces sp. HNM0645]|uniref:M56 family metallopeptidase n=1 Tax=Streptomyces sp. HNM0645 TaxID=2782343 RepID=UPI0024B8272C|nr:M56 family metallopeptidase [Streptomyces sp. HNM0645]MDI9884433.1 M56 family metallopeptidase [Streptomyces sp. HNM0645]
MGVFVFLPLVLPLTAWPIARLAEQHLHPRTATCLLAGVGALMALCSTLCLALIMVVGTAQLPGNPLPDTWSDPEVREAVPYDEVVGKAAIPALVAVAAAAVRTVWRQHRVRRRAERALEGLPPSPVAVLPDDSPYAYALPGGRGPVRGRIVVSTGMLARLDSGERRALFAHERAHLAAGHHRHLLAARLASRANPFLRPLHTAVAYCAERWADEEAAGVIGDRRVTARAVGKAGLVSRGAPFPLPAGFATGPVPRRVAALLGPVPPAGTWPPAFTAAGAALWTAAAGAAVSALSSANSAVALFLVLKAATPL